MAATVDLWTPPDGMLPAVTAAWRAFYAKALDEYGITPADYRLLYVAQRGRCWICRTAKGIHPDDPKARGGRRLGIDHNHTTGVVRGLLCTGGDKTCNRVIGWLNRDQLQRAADYLDRPPARVLPWARNQEQAANEAGVPLDQAELDTLAMVYLWPMS
jgi:hypothetical protein